MPTIYIEGQPYAFEGDQRNVLDVCLSLGFDIPYFCWHPAMHSVGACRQCAVKLFHDENDTRGRIVMSCMTPATDGLRISIEDEEARAFRADVIEWLMLNHPHDCPVCDEGGECHLQDMTVMTGHVYRRTRFPKRTHRNQYLGPFVAHEMNRCIQCYRCVRFYNDYAGGRDLNVFGWHDHVWFGRHEPGVLESVFSGNLVEVCPTGVFTDKTFKQHFTRKWDLQTAPSVCVHCGLGCNTIPGERYGSLRRIRNRYNGQVNGYFLCDRGRFGYEFVNSDRRIRHPHARARDGSLQTLSPADALAYLGAALCEGTVIGIGSPRASLEANFALRSLVGAERFFDGMAPGESRLMSSALRLLQAGPAPAPSLQAVAEADAVLILGEDVSNTAPMLAFSLRRAVLNAPIATAREMGVHDYEDSAVREALQQECGPMFIATPAATALDELCAGTYRAAPDDIARLGFAVARELDSAAPEVADLSAEARDLATHIAEALRNSRHAVVISGPGCGSEAVLEAAASVAWALRRSGTRADVCFTAPECNSMGLALLGAGDLSQALAAVREKPVDTLIVVENDLYRRLAPADVEALLHGARRVVVIDHIATRTSARADLVLPAATFAESTGTLVNSEGRAQRFFQVCAPGDDIREAWRWLSEAIHAQLGPEAGGWARVDDLLEACARELPALAALPGAAPGANFRLTGRRVPRQPHRYSGRTAMTANVDVNEPPAREDLDSPLAFSMEGSSERPPGALIAEFWAPGWNSVASVNKFQDEVCGPLCGGDPGARLIEPPAEDGSGAGYPGAVPPAFAPREDQWLIVALHHVFGSEELSALSPGIAELAEEPYLALGPEGARRLEVLEGRDVAVTIGGHTHWLRLRIRPELPAGVAGLPVGLPGLADIEMPFWGSLSATGEVEKVPEP